jgi:GDP-D-mannose 3',5'-epimerase
LLYIGKINMNTALVLGGGGFIGSHMVDRLKAEGFWVRAVDLKLPEYSESNADEFIKGDLRDPLIAGQALDRSFDEVYQFAADMGGAGFIFTGENDANIMHNSALVNLNVLEEARKHPPGTIFYSSSACIYPEHNQLDPDNPNCAENTAYPANPDSEYGWEKLFSERLYLAYKKNYKLNVHIARYHNIFGPLGTWQGGREKAPAAICRKVALAANNDDIEVWGDGKQTRSFLYVDECIEGTIRLTRSTIAGPVNIGSSEMISINNLVKMVSKVANKNLSINNVPGPLGVRGRNSDNSLIQQSLGWSPSAPLEEGIRKTYSWIASQIESSKI